MIYPSIKLADRCDLITKGTTPTSLGFDFTDSGIPFIRAQNLVDGTVSVDADPLFIDSATHVALRRSIIKPNDVLISIAGTIGRAAIVPPDAVYMNCNQAVAIVRANSSIDRRFLLHWLNSQDAVAQIARGKVTGTISNLSLGQIGSLEIPLPPLEEQKRIAAILDQADALRRLRARALDRLNALGQAIFHEMFGDPIDDAPVGSGWINEPLDTNIHFIDYRGKTPPKAVTGIRLITAKNVKMGFVNVEPQEFIVAEAFDEWMTRGFPRNGDVLFTTEAPLGNVAILNCTDKVAVGQRLITMQPDQSKIDNVFLVYLLRTLGFRKRMFEFSTGSTVVGIKSSLLKKIEIRYPKLELQRQFSAALTQSEFAKASQEQALISSESLFTSLQHRAFRGEL